MLTQYLELIDYSTNSFLCCKNPTCITVDGIVLSVKNNLIKEQFQPEEWLDCETLHQRFSTRHYRNIINFSKEDRKVIRLFCKGDGTLFDNNIAGLSLGELDRFQIQHKDQSSNRNHPVTQLMKLSANKIASRYHCHPMYAFFLRSLYKDITPASLIAPQPIWSSLKELLLTKKLTLLIVQNIQIHSPVLDKVFVLAMEKRGDTEFFEIFLELTELIYRTSVKCYTTQYSKGKNRFTKFL